VKDKKYKYDKTFLKIDLLQSNFNYDDHIDVESQNNKIDINVEEEYSDIKSSNDSFDDNNLKTKIYEPHPFKNIIIKANRLRTKSADIFITYEPL
jgi:hypothetical protein